MKKNEFDIVAEASIWALDAVGDEIYAIITIERFGGLKNRVTDKNLLKTKNQDFFDDIAKTFSKEKKQAKGKVYHKYYQYDFMLSRIIDILTKRENTNFSQYFVIENDLDVYLDAATLAFVYLEREKAFPLICKETGLNQADLIQKLEHLKNTIIYSSGIHREAGFKKSIGQIKTDRRNLKARSQKYTQDGGINDRLRYVKKLAKQIDPTGTMKKWTLGGIIAKEVGVSSDTIVKSYFKKLGIYQE